MSFENLQKYLIFFSYLGKHYKGVQSQTRRIPTFETIGVKTVKEDKSIQIQLEKAFNRLLPKPKNEIKVGISSRTDAGVNALINSCQLSLAHPIEGCYYIPSHIVKTANDYFLNHNQSIILRRVVPVHHMFVAVLHALSRTYVYRIAVVKKPIHSKTDVDLTSLLPIDELYRCLPVCSPQGYLDIAKMQEVCDLFIGTHDFTSFRSPQIRDTRPSERTIYECFLRFIPDTYLNGCDPAYKNIDIIEIVIKGKSFLYNQVRRMVGALIAVGKGKNTVEEIRSFLHEPGSGKGKIIVPPPDGLYLANIEYDTNGLYI
ncbi:pseudouridylate synthase-like protein [Leptotrombidium deliense]|uniref:tRNA pseudouridine synthase n=1 Tax=Leptotrombidium deliense TaxID=299467 RepID=A0A443SPA3_9ACAR|nr:pseudouridylate synthase-like protein [Leptotrombidium deliense]